VAGVVTWIPVGPAARTTLGGFGADELVDWLESATSTGFDIGDRWPAVVTALVEAGPALGALVTGGDALGPDLGPGPARLLAPGEVAALAAVAGSLPEAEIVGAAGDPTIAADLAVVRRGLRIAADGGKALLIVHE
jgi:hypothetical protein